MTAPVSSNMTKNIFWHKASARTLGLLGMQQLIAASSTIWLANLMDDAVHGNRLVINLGLYLSSLTVVYLPAYFMDVQLRLWVTRSFGRFIELFVRTNKGQISHWNNAATKDQRLTVLASDSLPTIQQTVHTLFDASQVGLNILLNILALSGVISPLFLLSYASSLVTIIICLHVLQKPISQRSQQLQGHRLQLNGTLWRSWDNLVLNNQRNFNTWQQEMNSGMVSFEGSSVKEAKIVSLGGILPTLLAMLPVLATVVYLLITRQSDLAYVAALLALLPRHMQILNNLEAAVRYGTAWHSIKAQIDGLLAVLKENKPQEELNQRIQWNKIRISHNGRPMPYPSLMDFAQAIRENNQGRWTIQGSNGAGKTSLLLTLKKELGTSALYIPTKHDLAFTGANEGLSSGQKTLRLLQWLENEAHETLLLDEWDANLDDTNTSHTSRLLDGWSDTRAIVEIRH